MYDGMPEHRLERRMKKATSFIKSEPVKKDDESVRSGKSGRKRDVMKNALKRLASR